MKRRSIISLLALLLALAGCGGVSREAYDRVCAERDALQARLEEAEVLPVTVSGTFAARVRDLIPDYVLDSETPRVAVVTLFQSGPFTLQVGDLAQELEIGGTYVFEIEPREDLEITAPETGYLTGRVVSVIFKGAYYEIKVRAGEYDWSIQDVNPASVGSMVGLTILPDNIQIMHKPHSEDAQVVREDE